MWFYPALFLGNGIHTFVDRRTVNILPRHTIDRRDGNDMPQHAADDDERQQ
jgi:hypothetical protein